MSRSPSRLNEYQRKRDFGITGEPKGSLVSKHKRPKQLEFVVQKHAARRLHFDFRLEFEGLMKSWAVTKGPSYNPVDKRLAVQTEDHPLEYNKFEGVIPAKQYGAGPVMIWDAGTWEPEGDVHEALKKGHLTFQLRGQRLKGRWHLVLMKTGSEKRLNWLLIKGEDHYASVATKSSRDFLEQTNTSVTSGRTLDEIRAGFREKKAKGGAKRASAANSLANAVGADASPQTRYGKVALATLVEFPPLGDDWVHEIKFDGYRLLAFLDNGKVTLRTRGQKDWTPRFTGLASELERLPAKSAVLDGEAGVVSASGATSFSALQAALSDGHDDRIELWLFDLLSLNGKDLTAKPLLDRKAQLSTLLEKTEGRGRIHYSEHFEGEPGLLDRACRLGAEGIVSKLKHSPYRARRTRDWVKSKCGLEQEFVIGGFMPAQAPSRAVGSLLLGYYQAGKFCFAGKVGTGFDQRTAQQIYRRLQPLKIARSPFDAEVARGLRRYVWVEPSVLCEVAFWEWTPDKHIRHASFKGLREDKPPRQVHEEVPTKLGTTVDSPRTTDKKETLTVGRTLITHPDREVYPGTGITKGDVATYYGKVMPYLLPFAKGRLLSVLRCTESIQDACFFQRSPIKGGAGNVFGLTVEHKGRKHNYMYIEDAAGILELVQFGAIEFHAWQSTVSDISRPDQIIIDLDPGEGVPFEAVKLAAIDVRNRLKNFGIISFPRLSGGKGLHVSVPLKARMPWHEVKQFTYRLAKQMEHDAPAVYTSSMRKNEREGKIFVDYLRNDFSSTAVTPFSLRARAGAPVAVPVTWRALDRINTPSDFTLRDSKTITNKKTEKIIHSFFNSRKELERYTPA